MIADEAGDEGEQCVFCDIVEGRVPASVVAADAFTVAFMDVRQYHPGHVLIIPRRHISDIREMDDMTGAALMRTLGRVARAVDGAFPNDGLSIWHSAGEGANQEVPHLHFHVHPRRFSDDVLRVYPAAPTLPERGTLDKWAEEIRTALGLHGVTERGPAM